MNISKAHYRSLLLKDITERNISTYTVNKIMSLFGDMTEEEKERTAQALIPKVENCKTAEQILAAVKTEIMRTKTKYK